jgi:hypothetical protein
LILFSGIFGFIILDNSRERRGQEFFKENNGKTAYKYS